MQKQFRKETAPPTPRYAPDTVREVLARASVIDAQMEQEALTPKQLLTLGKELGLSPNAVRYALGEVLAPLVQTTNVRTPLTREQETRGFLPLIVMVLFAYPFFKMFMGTSFGNNLCIIAVFLPLLYSGWMLKSVRYSGFGAVYFFAISFILQGKLSSIWNPDCFISCLLASLIGTLVFILSVWAGKWFDELPRLSDR